MPSDSASRTARTTRQRPRFDPDSRYKRNAVVFVDVRDGQRKVDFQPPTIDPDPSDDILEVLPEEDWRPDMVASRAYDGRHNLAWVVMRANKLFHVSELRAGMVIRVPSLSRLEGTIV